MASRQSTTMHPTQSSLVYDGGFSDPPAQPLRIIESLIIESGKMSVPLEEIESQLAWGAVYEEFYGPLDEYLNSYQSVFIVSPLVDSVAMRLFTKDTSTRRSTKPQKRSNLTDGIGSISYSSIAESFDLVGLEALYRSRGLDVQRFLDEALRVSCATFDLFVLDCGVVVWWGMDRSDHWCVDDDFLRDGSQVLRRFTNENHWQKDVFELFPVWCTYQYSNSDTPVISGRQVVDEDMLLRFQEKLCFDHYGIPSQEPLRSQVMLAVSQSLARSAKVDYYERMLNQTQIAVFNFPSEPKGFMNHFPPSNEIAKLQGEIQMMQMHLTSLHDTPEILWEMPWLRAYFVMCEEQNTVDSRRDWYGARTEALLQKLENISARRHRLFMMSSDVFLIILLVLDVISLLLRLSSKMFLID